MVAAETAICEICQKLRIAKVSIHLGTCRGTRTFEQSKAKAKDPSKHDGFVREK